MVCVSAGTDCQEDRGGVADDGSAAPDSLAYKLLARGTQQQSMACAWIAGRVPVLLHQLQGPRSTPDSFAPVSSS